MRLFELLEAAEGLGRSLLYGGLSLFVLICGAVLIVRSDDWSGRSFGLVLVAFGVIGAGYYYRAGRRAIREYSAPEEEAK